ncbi:MAG: DUF692 domain-containing protein [Phycisphaerales bacterium]|nr:DUF692 domain-containing protein [Phycisphaerales bacterium]MCB9857191.1 DUF692 domain-containing protein [Phycisphaerales bacterium]MCB9863096.1 DUF692 domain-containing protein [Phycisphaerales bacterium]
MTGRFDDIPRLGVGVGFRAPFKTDLFVHRRQVDFLEITVDHFLDRGPDGDEELQLLADHFTLIPHGLDLSLGSAEGLSERYLERIATIVEAVRPPYWSEHIAFTRAGGIEIGHLSPLPFTYEAIDVLAKNVDFARRSIDVPLILENITYAVQMPGAEMSEAEFLQEIVERTGCGLLLDVTNLYTNAVNHRFDANEMIDALPLDAIVQLHFVGGRWEGDTLIDSHSSATPPQVWALLETILRRAPVKGVILERDENIPPFAEILDELRKARSIWDKVSA